MTNILIPLGYEPQPNRMSHRARADEQMPVHPREVRNLTGQYCPLSDTCLEKIRHEERVLRERGKQKRKENKKGAGWMTGTGVVSVYDQCRGDAGGESPVPGHLRVTVTAADSLA